MESCELCQVVRASRAGTHPFLVHEFEHALLLVGQHQRFAGYCVLVASEHQREPFDCAPEIQRAIFDNLMTSAQAIQRAFRPWKMNYGCYGNVVPHVHWHLFPRYDTDPLLQQTPWAQSARFDEHRTTETQARDIASRIRVELGRLPGPR